MSVPVRDVISPKVKRPHPTDPLRADYDATLKLTLHMSMISAGILGTLIMAVCGVNILAILFFQGVVPAAVQEYCDHRFRL